MKHMILMLSGVALSACAVVQEPAPIVAPAPQVSGPVTEPEAQILAEAAKVDPGGSTKTGVLGTTIATLDAKLPGMMVKTPLVDVTQDGQIQYAGRTVKVQLIPITGPDTGGTFVSLPAMQAVGAPLAGLPKLTVIGL
ncbi:hypothetical protein N6L24_01660 [Cognatishimia sp. SS12]|uniref:hypothetical protein n=1 Tax=Cognatishimia sp. SS12 TaxID=2979465 RepID=UPI00232DC79F|nr:hypothetical protein [Cognatishimia sp. SS12]MDC0736975.1 hypothetical protein [Cognatishimia sp. SS12]